METKSTVERFTCCLAGTCVEIQALYPETREFCRDYLTEEEPDFTVTITPQDIRQEKEIADRNSRETYGRAIAYPEPYLERLAVYRKVADNMLDFDTVLFHGSAIAMDGVAYLFTAASGTGKSTHTRLWRQVFGPAAWMVNDDKPLLRVTADGVFVCGTPWDGKHHLSRNVMVPLKAICLLTRDESNHIEPMSRKEAFLVFLQQIYQPEKAEAMQKLLYLMERIMDSVKLYRLGCNMDPDAARVAYEGMKGSE